MNEAKEKVNDNSFQENVLDEVALMLRKYIQSIVDVESNNANYENEKPSENDWRNTKAPENEESTSVMVIRKINGPEKNNAKVESIKFKKEKAEREKIENKKKVEENQTDENRNEKYENPRAETFCVVENKNTTAINVLIDTKELCLSEKTSEKEISIACTASCRSKIPNNSNSMEDVQLGSDSIFPKNYSSEELPNEEVYTKPKILEACLRAGDREIPIKLPQIIQVETVSKTFFEKEEGLKNNISEITSDLSKQKHSAPNISKFGIQNFPTDEYQNKGKINPNAGDQEMSNKLPQITQVKDASKMFYEKKRSWLKKNKIEMTSDLPKQKDSASTTSTAGTLKFSIDESQNKALNSFRNESYNETTDILNSRQKNTEQDLKEKMRRINFAMTHIPKDDENDSTSFTMPFITDTSFLMQSPHVEQYNSSLLKCNNISFDNEVKSITKCLTYKDNEIKRGDAFSAERNSQKSNKIVQFSNVQGTSEAPTSQSIDKIKSKILEVRLNSRDQEVLTKLSQIKQVQTESKTFFEKKREWLKNNKLDISDLPKQKYSEPTMSKFRTQNFSTDEYQNRSERCPNAGNQKSFSKSPQKTQVKDASKTFFEKKNSWLKKNKFETTWDIPKQIDSVPTMSKAGTLNFSTDDIQNQESNFSRNKWLKTKNPLNLRQETSDQELNDEMRRINISIAHLSKDNENNSTSFTMHLNTDNTFRTQSSHLGQNNSSLGRSSFISFENENESIKKCLTYEDNEPKIDDVFSAERNSQKKNKTYQFSNELGTFEAPTTQSIDKIKGCTPSRDIIIDVTKNTPEPVSVIPEQRILQGKNFLQDSLKNDYGISAALEESHKGSVQYSADFYRDAYSLLQFAENASEPILDEKLIDLKELCFKWAEYNE